MRILIKTLTKLSLSTVTNVILGIVKNKAFAVLLGTGGFGLAAQFINLNYFLLFVGGFGIPLALAKYISQFESEFSYAVGTVSSLRMFANRLGKKWLKGISFAKKSFT